MVLCRFCLFEIENAYGVYNLFTPLTQPNTMKETLALSVMQFVPINITLNDGLPETICSNCYDDLSASYKFCQTCLNSDTSLRNGPRAINPPKKVQPPDSFAFGDNNSAAAPSGEQNPDTGDYFKLNALEKLTCNICLKKFKHHGRYVLHMQRHNVTSKPENHDSKLKHKAAKSESFSCKICFKTFHTRKALDRHKERHSVYNLYAKAKLTKKSPHVESPPVLKCTQCAQSFPTIRQLYSHIRKTHGIEPNSTRKKNDTKDIIKNDVNETNVNLEDKKKIIIRKESCLYVCTFCNQRFRNFTRFKFHTKMHLQSPVCGKGLGTKTKANEHHNVHS